jgi:hypothetical protein
MKELIVVYELEQVDAVERYVTDTASHAKIIALNYVVEQEFIKRSITVLPFTNYCKSWTDSPEIVARVLGLSREWYRLPEMSFLEHKGLRIGEMFEAMISMYLQDTHSYLFLFKRMLDMHPDIGRLTVPLSRIRASSTTGPFALFQINIIAATGKFCAEQRGIAFGTIGTAQNVQTALFPRQPLLRTILLRIYNFSVGIFTPKRPLRILVSDHWRNIKSFIENMDDTELVFVDRKELRNIPWRQLWKHRIRFIHSLDALTPKIRAIARSRQKEWRDIWPEAKKAISQLSEFTYDGFNWWPLVEPVFTMLVGTYAERVIADIESVQSILEKEDINRVLIRASISGQHHFFILGELPHHIGLPSFEIQHGIGVGILDPDSSFGHLHADYLVAYGPLVQRALVRNGYSKERIQPTGSPRFDRYFKERDALTHTDRDEKLTAMGLDPKRPVIFVIMPLESDRFMFGSTDLTSYEYRDYLRSLQLLKGSIPEIQYILKFRSLSQLETYRSFIEELFPNGDVAMDHGDMFSLALLGDVVISSFSTSVCECIMARKPVVLYPLKETDTYFYEAHKDGVISAPFLTESSGIPINEVTEVTRKLLTDKTFYTDAVKKGERYLEENFTFTGDAAQKVTDFLRATSLPPQR